MRWVILATLVAGCGGGGGSVEPEDTASQLDGPYYRILFRSHPAAANSHTSEFAVCTLDGLDGSQARGGVLPPGVIWAAASVTPGERPFLTGGLRK